ncbi:MiaB/RimO family radical SAM methylthiotransferase [Candidatus Roizmanbacteria bacterium]|nr:MiaB/RimO family radical SAM methylthiotransferase [Candidatus Roizmanbacteria bacterium]
MKYFIRTFGCQQNTADSERIAAAFQARNMTPARGYSDANYVVLNTCMVRESAENRVYGLVKNLTKLKREKAEKGEVFKIIVTGCMVGVAHRDTSGKYYDKIRSAMPGVDEFMPIQEVGFDLEPVRQNETSGSIPISNGCNNFCTYCVVPFTRGREVSRPYETIIAEAKTMFLNGYKSVMLLGQNVNSYGADLTYDKAKMKPVYVKHLGRYRIATLFPHLLEEVARIGFEKVEFFSSNPWDFSDELIEVIARNSNITRSIHLPVQSGDNNMLKRMNRWYTREEYMDLITKIRASVPNVVFTTDIIVGFCGETSEEFENTVDLCRQVQFDKAYVARYSSRPMTAATKVMKDDVSHREKKRRWQVLEDLINKPMLERLKKKYNK